MPIKNRWDNVPTDHVYEHGVTPMLDHRCGYWRRKTSSQWRAIGWNYQPVMTFDHWCDIGRPRPSPRVFDHPRWFKREYLD